MRNCPGSPLWQLVHHGWADFLAADGLFTPDGRFHCMPAEDLAPAIDHIPPKGQQCPPRSVAFCLAKPHSA